MAQYRLTLRRLVQTVLLWALPGLAVIAALAMLHVLSPLWAIGAALGCLLIAAIIGLPQLRDLAALAQFGDELAHVGKAANLELSGWAPAVELAATVRRIAREAELRERHLHESARASRRVFDELPQPILLLDGQRRIRAVNQSAHGLVAGDPTNSDLAIAIRDPRVLEAVDHTLATGERRAVGFSVALPVEHYFWAEIVPFGDTGGADVKVMVALYDLTERRQAERMRGDFIANLSHELRTPLATLIGFIETLRGPAHDDAKARDDFLALMQDQADRMSRLVRDLLSLSAIEMNEHAAPQNPVDVGDLVERVIAALRLEAAKVNTDLIVERKGPARPVIGDDDQLTQLFQNLVDNAIKYGRKGGTVRITVEESTEIPPTLPRAARETPPAAVVRVAVTDQGPGIPAEHIPRLTERFYRVDAARSRAVGGTGLGLAIVKHIVNRHRGLLQIESRAGQGATFRVVLPVTGRGDKS